MGAYRDQARHGQPKHMQQHSPPSLNQRLCKLAPVPTSTLKLSKKRSTPSHQAEHSKRLKHSSKGQQTLQVTTTYSGLPPTAHIHSQPSKSSQLIPLPPLDVDTTSSSPSTSDHKLKSDSSDESPGNIPTPSPDAIDNHPSSPSEDFTSYSQLISRMAKSL